MHRCQIRMRHKRKTPSAHLLDCGDAATKKVGQIWVCDYHYKRFGIPVLGEDYFVHLTGGVDSDSLDDRE